MIRTFGSWSRDGQTVMGDGLLYRKQERICWGTEGSNPSVLSAYQETQRIPPFLAREEKSFAPGFVPGGDADP
jgi:hypothetical protein